MPCWMVNAYQSSEVPSCLHLQQGTIFSSRIACPWRRLLCKLPNRRSTQHDIQKHLKCQQRRCKNPKSPMSNNLFYYCHVIGRWIVSLRHQGNAKRAQKSWVTQTYTVRVLSFKTPRMSGLLGQGPYKLPRSTMLRIRSCICKSNLLWTLPVRAWLFPLP